MYSSKVPVTHMQTNQLIRTCIASEYTDSYIRQYISKTIFENTIHSHNVELLSNASLDIL